MKSIKASNIIVTPVNGEGEHIIDIVFYTDATVIDETPDAPAWFFIKDDDLYVYHENIPEMYRIVNAASPIKAQNCTRFSLLGLIRGSNAIAIDKTCILRNLS